MLNMDMISRGGPDSLSVEGSGRTPELRSLIEDCNKPLGLKLANNTDDGFGGSDHQPFLDKGIPAVHFFTGLHKDYHQVSDNPDLADAAKAAKVAQLVFQTAVALSGTTQKLTLNPESD
jgi:Zn-dependent M28 family amino/carboxypeptidase